ncbi:hypothetical protein EJV46_02070 [Roseococcus sp. SYP-B2431]|uniref:DUF6931 family protein n=1 Tax=Roseococcus sp. SYP-B2431 TaxID=2496640 RepID=UPI00103E6C0B|nr:hypothetical protein [Roseococcus sp. SYP-B2431]TCH99486.1 hypothetical protein EJV46_02070 [Roseococcus sp. SYP-B2431]
MSASSPNKLTTPLEPLLPRLELDGPGTSLVTGLPDAAAGVARLAEAGRMPDALRLVAHALPKREAVWWACMCARAVPVAEPPACDSEALTAAETWVRKPDEPARRATMEVAQRGGFRSPEAWAAVAAFWSGGSMAPEGQPVVPPADHLTGVAVAGAIILAATRVAPEKAEARFQRFLQSARDIAGGGAGRLEPEKP